MLGAHISTRRIALSGRRESNPVYIHPMDAYYRYTTPRQCNPLPHGYVLPLYYTPTLSISPHGSTPRVFAFLSPFSPRKAGTYYRYTLVAMRRCSECVAFFTSELKRRMLAYRPDTTILVRSLATTHSPCHSHCRDAGNRTQSIRTRIVCTTGILRPDSANDTWPTSHATRWT